MDGWEGGRKEAQKRGKVRDRQEKNGGKKKGGGELGGEEVEHTHRRFTKPATRKKKETNKQAHERNKQTKKTHGGCLTCSRLALAWLAEGLVGK